MFNLPSNEKFLITFREPDIEKLKADAYGVVIHHHAAGHDNIKAQFRVCFWRNKYLMVTRIPIVGTERKTNKAIAIYKGTNAIKKYVVAKWRFDHRQSHDIQWNVIEFDCDGDSVRSNTAFEESVLKAAERDVHSGIIDRSIKGLLSALHSITLGKYRWPKQ